MRLLAVFPPARRESLINDVLKDNGLTLKVGPRRTWCGDARIEPGADAPLIWSSDRTGRLSMATLGHKAPFEPKVLTVPAQGVRIGRRCLVPVSAIEIEEGGRTYRLTPNGEPYAFIGATWWPSGKDRHYEPGSVALLTTGPQPDFEGVLSEGFVYVPTRDRRDWLDSTRDTLSLQKAPGYAPFEIEEIATLTELPECG